VTELRVLVVADDLGYDPAIDAGILEAHRSGVVTAASALVDGPFAEAVIRSAPATLALGLHLRLPPGMPEREAEAEIHRQLARLEALRGTAAAHVDGHRHVHAEPQVLAPLLRVAGARRLRVRALDAGMRLRIREAGAIACDRFLGDAGLRPCWTPERLAAAARDLLPGSTEIMIHPGHRPTHVRTSFGVEREIELAAAVAPAVSAAFRAAGASLAGRLEDGASGG
jgi:predicted glycoside hydrolase/deacetylase ChbG (UPF0249 family)